MDATDRALPRLTTAQTAARLGVKPATLYAYVSRGLISSERAETGGSTFDALDVEELAQTLKRSGPATQTTRSSQQSVANSGRPLMVLDSDLTLIENDDLFYRGRRATELAARGGAEGVMELLWGLDPRVELTTAPGFVAPEDVVRRARAAGDLLGSPPRLIDRLALTVTVAGSLDPLRDDLAPDVVFAAGRRLIGAMVDALPDAHPDAAARPRLIGTTVDARPDAPQRTVAEHPDTTADAAAAHPDTPADTPAGHPASLAERLWPKLSTRRATARDIAVLDSALILCVDHDLAVATLAARVAASARAHPYAAVSAALGAFDSSLHGSMSVAAGDMLREAMESGHSERSIARQASSGRGIPGFGHTIYRDRDPRFAFLLARMHGAPDYAEAVRQTERLVAVVSARVSRPANLDLALATLVVGAGMRSDSGQVIFAIARTAGWLAHVVAEYGEPPLRLRPSSHYTGLRG